MRLLLLALLLGAASAVPDFRGALNSAMDLVNPMRASTAAKSLFGWSFGAAKCEFVPEPSASVAELLRRELQGQDAASAAIVDAVNAWEFARGTADAVPLVLAFSGPTGVGKTKTSNLLGEALLAHTFLPPGAQRPVPRGWYVLRGEDYKDPARGVDEYQRLLRQQVFDHVSACRGVVVVLIDEVQKMRAGVLDALLTAMGDQHELVLDDGRRVDTTDVVFLLVSDIGAEAMQKVMVASGGRNKAATADLMAAVKVELDAQWERLHFSTMVDQVIPFLPLTMAEMQHIFRASMDLLSERRHGELWDELRVTDAAAQQLCGVEYVQYLLYTLPDGREFPQRFAKYGARNLVKGVFNAVHAALFRSLRPPDTRAVVWLDVDAASHEMVVYSCPRLLAGEDGPGAHCKEKHRQVPLA